MLLLLSVLGATLKEVIDRLVNEDNDEGFTSVWRRALRFNLMKKALRMTTSVSNELIGNDFQVDIVNV